MKVEEYIEERIDKEIERFNRLANYNKHLYYTLSFIKIALPAVIYVVGTLKVNVMLMCASVIFIPEINKLVDRLIVQYRIYDKWIIYGQSRETLIRERFLAKTRAESYKTLDDSEIFIHLVEQTESIIHELNINLYVGKRVLKNLDVK